MDDRSIKEKTLERAARITPLVTSITLGPKSSYNWEDIEQETEKLEQSDVTDNKENKTPHQTPTSKSPHMKITVNFDTDSKLKNRSVKMNKSSSITSSDLRAMQDKFYMQSEERKLNEQVRKQMEARIAIENEHYQKIQRKLEAMQLEAERKHKAKIEAIARQLETALKIDEQDEMDYQRQRQELAKNNRKILEQQEKELRENLKRLEDHFAKLEESFNKLSRSCSTEMAPIVDLYKQQFEELKVHKNSTRSSLDGLRNVCVKADAICQGLMKAKDEHDIQLERRDQKEAEDRQAAAVAAQIQAEAAEQVAQAAPQPTPLQPETQIVAVQPPQPNQLREAERIYNESMQLLVAKQNSTRLLTGTPELEVIRFALKMAINTPINLLNEQNQSTLLENFQKLSNLLSGQRITTNKGAVAVTDHIEATDWTKLRIAEKLIVRTLLVRNNFNNIFI